MLYATYEYYAGSYYGSMTADEYGKYGRRASAYIDQITLGRAGALPKESPFAGRVMDACCAVADAYKRNEQGAVTSETNADHSITISRGNKSDARRLYEAAALYLGHTGLLYRGVD